MTCTARPGHQMGRLRSPGDTGLCPTGKGLKVPRWLEPWLIPVTTG